MEDWEKRMMADHADIEAHGPYQVTVTCRCRRKTTTIIPKEDWLKDDGPRDGRTIILARLTCPKCSPDEFGEDDES